MKFATVLLFSVEAFLLVKAHRLDFTSAELSADDVDQHTLKTKDSEDTREVKLFASMYSDGFDSVVEDNFKLWGDDKTYKCSYAKVYFKDGKTLGVKLGLVRKDPGHFTKENSTEAFLRKVAGKWFVVSRKVFWSFVQRVFEVNYADRSYEEDEEFDRMEPNLGIARPPLRALKLVVHKHPEPNFPFKVSRELPQELKVNETKEVLVVPPKDHSENANPLSELDEIPNPPKTTKPKKDLGEEAHPMAELDNMTGPVKDPSEGEVKGGVKEDESPRVTPEEKEARLRKKGEDKSVVVKEDKDGEKSSFLTNSLLIPGIIMMFYTFN
ncbi:hypothetical protein MACK_000131 [Theileria orientalis]|uniref:Uncharacterized protein n=1 Tax=Theileria orientalis TaxID=68886 RepID=A0A976M8Y7_THEOR|nr:hypothetical protein MACK_000131 [Theileria orientalis]